MACKSAHIDATLRLAGLSEVFTQDLDEQPSRGESGGEASALAISEPGHVVPQLTRTQLEILELRIRRLGLDRDRVLHWLKRATKGQCTRFEALTPELYGKLLTKLESWARPRPVVPPSTGLPEPEPVKPSGQSTRPAPRSRRPKR